MFDVYCFLSLLVIYDCFCIVYTEVMWPEPCAISFWKLTTVQHMKMDAVNHLKIKVTAGCSKRPNVKHTLQSLKLFQHSRPWKPSNKTR